MVEDNAEEKTRAKVPENGLLELPDLSMSKETQQMGTELSLQNPSIG